MLFEIYIIMLITLILKEGKSILIYKEGNTMIEVSYLREKEILKIIPQEVQVTIRGILQILDSEYGANRNKYEDNGGYVVRWHVYLGSRSLACITLHNTKKAFSSRFSGVKFRHR